MEVRERILSNLIINEKALSEQSAEQFKQHQESLNTQFSDTNNNIVTQTSTLSDNLNVINGSIKNAVVPAVNNTQEAIVSSVNSNGTAIVNAISQNIISTLTNEHSEVISKLSQVGSNIQDVKNTDSTGFTQMVNYLKVVASLLNEVAEAIYQPVIITGEDGKTYTAQRQKPVVNSASSSNSGK